MSTSPADPVDRGAAFIAMRPPERFFRVEIRSSLLLLGAAVAALVWANSAWMASYEVLWTTDLSVRVGESMLAKDLRHWVNDGLMALFFLVGGLEMSHEVRLSKGRDWSAGVMPALGGVVLAALFYLTVTLGSPAAWGWPIAMATDLALVLGLLTVVRRRWRWRWRCWCWSSWCDCCGCCGRHLPGGRGGAVDGDGRIRPPSSGRGGAVGRRGHRVPPGRPVRRSTRTALGCSSPTSRPPA